MAGGDSGAGTSAGQGWQWDVVLSFAGCSEATSSTAGRDPDYTATVGLDRDQLIDLRLAGHRFHAAGAERAGQDLGRTRVSRDDPAGRQVVKGRALVAHSAGQDHRVPHHQLRYQRPCPAAGDDSANPARNDLLEHRAGQRRPDSGMEHTQPHTAMLDLPQRCRAHLAVQAAHWPGVGPAEQFLDDVPEEARHSDRRRVDRTDQPARLDDRLTGQILILQ